VGARLPVWTYAAGVSDNSGYPDKARRCGCPCTDFAAPLNPFITGPPLRPTFYCSAGHHDDLPVGWEWLPQSPLWLQEGALPGGEGGFPQCAAEALALWCPQDTQPSSSPSGAPVPDLVVVASSDSGEEVVPSGRGPATGLRSGQAGPLLELAPIASSSPHGSRGLVPASVVPLAVVSPVVDCVCV
jgi:hypothetical protein